MQKKILVFLSVLFVSANISYSQNYKGKLNKAYVEKTLRESYTDDYLKLREKVISELSDLKPGAFGESVKGVYTCFDTDKKQIALTFDACIGQNDSYNEELINYLRKEKIPATLFVTGSWIDSNLEVVKQLAADDLFEIENHGLFHRVCSANGKTAYNIQPTTSMSFLVDEMELNSRKIAKITGRRPLFFRSATANNDEASVKLAAKLGMKIINFDVLSGDAIPFAPAKTIENNIVKKAHPGAIVIMHFNHPKWHEKEALQKAIPQLRALEYNFVKLKDVRLVTK